MSDVADRLWRRVLLVVGRGRVGTVNDAGQVQKLQVRVSADETIDGMPRLAEYGFQSHPPAGSDAVALFVAGERSNGVVIACGNQTYRLRGLKSGEVAISDDKGQSVVLSASGIQVNGGGLPIAISNTSQVSIDAPLVRIEGALRVKGDIASEGSVKAGTDLYDTNGQHSMRNVRDVFNAHRHGSSAAPLPIM